MGAEDKTEGQNVDRLDNMNVPQSITSPDALQTATRQPPDLSIIIVSWNVRDLLVRCIEAARNAKMMGDLKAEIIVVDNASTDGSADAARSFPGVRVIENQRNLGYGRANNIGFRAAQGKHLLVLNPDALPLPGSLSTLVQFARTQPKAGIIAPRLLNPDGSTQESAFRFPTLLMAAIDLFPLPAILPGRIRQWLTQSRLNGRYPHQAKSSRPFRIGHPLGACMLINKAAYDQLGGFDDNLFMYSEEVDLALRYTRAGWQCWQVPQARVVHLGGQSTRQLPDRMFVELWRSRLYICRKHYKRVAQIALALLLVISQLRDLLATMLKLWLRLLTPEEAERYRARARAVLRLVFQP